LLPPNHSKSGAVIVVLNDLEPHPVMVGEAAEAEADVQSDEEQPAP
jgi:hypothetical protein